MKCLITGATGFIGSRLTKELVRRGYDVNVLVRSPQKLDPLIAGKITIHKGDVLDAKSINEAVRGNAVIFHLAAFAGIWSVDKSLPYRINVTGTENVLKAAVDQKVQKVVYTSSAGTLKPSDGLEEIDEESPLPLAYHTDYEQTKMQAEQLCFRYADRGIDVVVVNPTRVFGPGPLNKSNSVTLLIKKYLEGKWRFLPGDGGAVGNYAYVDDVVDGHIKAMHSGVRGEKYLLGGTNLSLKTFFSRVAEAGGKNYRLFSIPHIFVSAFAASELFLAESLGKNPLITPPWADRYRQNRLVSSRKAMNSLNYNITPLPEALSKTIKWLHGC